MPSAAALIVAFSISARVAPATTLTLPTAAPEPEPVSRGTVAETAVPSTPTCWMLLARTARPLTSSSFSARSFTGLKSSGSDQAPGSGASPAMVPSETVMSSPASPPRADTRVAPPVMAAEVSPSMRLKVAVPATPVRPPKPAAPPSTRTTLRSRAVTARSSAATTCAPCSIRALVVAVTMLVATEPATPAWPAAEPLTATVLISGRASASTRMSLPR